VINCLFNDTNYWLNLMGKGLARKGKNLNLANGKIWLKLIQDLYKQQKSAGPIKVRVYTM
jgi:hypothetical protein